LLDDNFIIGASELDANDFGFGRRTTLGLILALATVARLVVLGRLAPGEAVLDLVLWTCRLQAHAILVAFGIEHFGNGWLVVARAQLAQDGLLAHVALVVVVRYALANAPATLARAGRPFGRLCRASCAIWQFAHFKRDRLCHMTGGAEELLWLGTVGWVRVAVIIGTDKLGAALVHSGLWLHQFWLFALLGNRTGGHFGAGWVASDVAIDTDAGCLAGLVGIEFDAAFELATLDKAFSAVFRRFTDTGASRVHVLTSVPFRIITRFKRVALVRVLRRTSATTATMVPHDSGAGRTLRDLLLLRDCIYRGGVVTGRALCWGWA